ncbi:MAG: SCO family protein [Steroidobacteraceae bacterium]
MNRSTLRSILLAMVAFVGGLFAARALHESRSPPEPPRLQRATWLPGGGAALPRLALLDQDGRVFDGSAFAEHWTVVVFGFTACPDVCPTTLAALQRLQRALADLPPAQRAQLLFVSVDPERDTPQQLREYLRAFGPGIIGATGTAQGVAAAAQAFGIGYARVPQPDGSYTMDHGASAFIVGPGGSIVATSPAPHDAAVLGADYRAIVAAYQKSS